tara:strand:- start:41316 stop:43604 length:2289 start_codon:yes stop_codon:yes gene_type:complete
MDKKYIYINDCIRWSGGINILIQLISTVKSSNQSNLEIVYVKPSILTKFINFLRLLLRGGSYRTNKLIDDDLYIKFENFVKEEELEITKYSYSEFKKLKVINYIFPVMKVNNSLKNKNLIGYIADCQHIHLPELFLRRTILYRNYQFKKVKKYCEKVMSTSDSVTHDLVKNYEFDFEKIFTIGFNPIRLEEDIEISKPDYDDYFLIANQLWEHKNHIYAIKAFKKYITLNPQSSTRLLCTGYIHDHRNSSYGKKLFNLIEELDLSNHIIFLGYLNRKEFLNYLVHSKALIQPTLFEGTPGSLSTADAVSYGVDVLLSNIPVNLEVDRGSFEYFDINNIDTLVALLSNYKNIDVVNKLSDSIEISEMSKKQYLNKITEISKTRFNIVIDITSFTKWSGGSRLIGQFIDLIAVNENMNLFIVNKKQKTMSSLFNLIKYRKMYSAQVKQEKKLKNELLDKVHENYPDSIIVSSRKISKKNRAVFPLLDFNPKFRNDTIYFIPDIGHKELSENFSSIIKLRRYIQIRLILTFSKHTLVNSRYIKNKIESNYRYIKTNINVAPFYGFIPEYERNQIHSTFENEFTNSKYFIVSNQFWVHKDHLTAIKATKILNQSLDVPIKLICTGFKIDYRGNDHIENINNYISENNLQNQIIFTDFLKRSELLNLIKNSIGLIQPSLYEGGPGGFSAADAISLDKPILISDIEINKEIKLDNRMLFFIKKNEHDLAKKMNSLIKNELLDSTIKTDYKKEYNNFLSELIYNLKKTD